MSKQGRPEVDRDKQQGAPPPELNRLDVAMGAERMAEVVADDKAHIHTIVPVHFARTRKTLYFYVGNVRVKEGDPVLVDAARGSNWGVVEAAPVRTISDGREYGRVLRLLSRDEESRLVAARRKEQEAAALCSELSAQMGLTLKVVDVEFTTSSNKAIFYFTAEERVDFRELVRELARHLRMTIEMRQIGARDETKILGGMGPCGLETCCSCHLNDFAPVTIKMAKNQDLALNPQKVSGLCGRLFCCLAYEDAVYTELKKGAPKRDSIIRTPDGVGRAIEVDIFKRRVKAAIIGKDHEWYELEKVQIGNDADREAVLAQEVAAREQREVAIEAQRERMRHFASMRARTAEKAERGDLGDTTARDVAPTAEDPRPAATAGEGGGRRPPEPGRERDRERGRERERDRDRRPPRGPGGAGQGAQSVQAATPPAFERRASDVPDGDEGGAQVPAEGVNPDAPQGIGPDGQPLPAEEGARREGGRRRRRRRRRGPREPGQGPAGAGEQGGGDEGGAGDEGGSEGGEGGSDGGSDDA